MTTNTETALAALKANHQHHQDYDDHGGYKGSDLEAQNLAAIAELESASGLKDHPSASAVLAELVECKAIKEEELRLRQRRECSIRREPHALARVNSMRDEYNRRAHAAWALAWAITDTTKPSSGTYTDLASDGGMDPRDQPNPADAITPEMIERHPFLAPCCPNEKRSMSGGCLSCGDPCL